jgi:hypothetical protein
MIITLLDHLIEMIIVHNLMSCRLDSKGSIPGSRIGINYSPVCPSCFGGLSIGEMAGV